MYRNFFLIAVCAMFLGYTSSAQENSDTTKPLGLKNKSSEEILKYYRTHHSRKPDAERMERLRNAISSESVKQQKSGESLEMPEKFWFPGEFEEVQAILISWSYIHVDTTEEYEVDPINKDTAYWEDDYGKICIGKYISYVDIYDQYSRLPIIFAKLADAIQQGGAQVWINIVNASDSTTIKKYMKDKGMPLKNYRFFVNPNNSIWYRDCGPVVFYYSDQDSLAFLDFEYYSGRPADDVIPIHLGNKLNIPVYTTTVKYEGGNIILDGIGTLFTSDEIYNGNNDTYGQIYLDNGELKYTKREKLTKQQVNDSLTYLLNLDRLKALPKLRYDGGTGHIDLYAAMWDENNFVFTKYPPQMSKFTDYAISSKNVDTILNMYSYFEKKYRGRYIPLPKKDDKTWYTSNFDFNKYTRTYSNSIFVNNVIIQPIFSNEGWGDNEWDLKTIEYMKKVFPGYKIIPIDIRGFEDDKDLWSGFDGSGGAIHCITKQIPTENPIRILHGAIQDFADDALYNGNFSIEATITNKSGIASATCFWKVKGDASWKSLSLDAGANNLFSATINRPTSLANDTIEYYISATSNNGKTITKPITAPDGFYSFYHGTDAVKEVVEDIYDYLTGIFQYANWENTMKISDFYPNPANDFAKIVIIGANNENINIHITNILGQTIYANSILVDENEIMLQLNTSYFTPGLYIVSFKNNKGDTINKKLVVGR
jgi:agmatine/peptidylarginine deiminase